MALCQKEFLDFHEKIKLKLENQVLSEKRDIIIKRIRENLSKDESKPFTIFNQGSYAMKTGIVPLDGNYDIDVGLYFDMSRDDALSVEAKRWVYNAVKNHTDNVVYKNPCVTVTYSAGYHVDITIYSATNANGKVYLAKGKPNSNAEDKFWDESNPKDLIEVVKYHLSDEEDRKQFRRVVRYLKRWKDIHFADVNGKPTGIALTSCAYHWLNIQKETDSFTGKKTYKDLDALIILVQQMISRFIDDMVEIDGEYKWMPRLKVTLPVEPKPDLFEKMTSSQMQTFKEKLERLLKGLEEAKIKVDPVDAAKILQKYFGTDFPIPTRPTTGKKSVAKAVIPSSESANI
ncbi:nucleotidyltransferase [Exiguobacterium sp. s152]|uniref:nucleotidyltransferase domain-containing protein n=1 Tax=Exiguobacterium sp. s152 TaxID=2751226 RepID=UPI001BE5A6DE|nr:nucleotidyltransferase [Exiguobacterium sp. s152]